MNRDNTRRDATTHGKGHSDSSSRRTGTGISRDRKPAARSSHTFGNRQSSTEHGNGGSRPRRSRIVEHDNSPYQGNAKQNPHKYTPHRKPKDTPAKNYQDDGTVRLNKFIANSGICSRREADTYISTGLVTINGKIVTELGTKVMPGDEVKFNGEKIRGEQKVYIVMNKPKNYVTTFSDPHAEKTVMDLITKDRCKERVFPVGRLDKATTGVLMFTNDGAMAERLTHPSFKVKKIYHVFLDKNLKHTDFNQILEGFHLEDGEIHADTLSYVDGDMTQIGIEIHSGRNRIVRRIFEHFGYKVKKLDRVYFAGLTKKNLKKGEWRFLTEREVNMLLMGAVN